MNSPASLPPFSCSSPASRRPVVGMCRRALSWGLMGLAAVYGAGFAHTTWTAAIAPSHSSQMGWVVVLGAGLDQGKTTLTFQARLERGARLVAEGRPGLLSGGDTGTGVSEAQAGLDWLTRAGWNQIWALEQESRTTGENIRLSSPLLDGQPVLLVTSRTHLARAHDLAKQAGWEVTPVAAEDRLEWSLGTVRALAWETLCRLATWGWP